MNTVLFINASISFSENLFLVQKYLDTSTSTVAPQVPQLAIKIRYSTDQCLQNHLWSHCKLRETVTIEPL